MRKFVLLAAVGGAIAIPQPGRPGAAQGQDEDFRWRGRMTQGKSLEIRGVLGDIHAERATGPEVEVVAVKRARRSDPADVEIEVVEHGRGVTICAVYPSTGRRANECAPGGGHNSSRNNDVNVHWTVRVPAGVAFEGHTVNGEVVIASLASDVVARTVNGDVDVGTTGFAEAATVNGSINVRMGRADWSGTARFKTVNGGITLEVPDGLNADIEAATVNGGIETDFPLTIQGRFTNRRMRGVIGTGGRTLELETVNGSIRLRRAS